MKVTIDPYSGFCFGVEKAIEMAEKELKNNKTLYCLGDIVHNQEEIERLNQLGLKSINYDTYNNMVSTKILVRAHGEPPETFNRAKRNNINIIDATCPIVIKLQERVKKAYAEMQQVKGQVVIFGKKNHPEVIGLAGQTNNTAIIIENETELSKLNFQKPVRLFSQTTRSKEDYNNIVEIIKKKINNAGLDTSNFKFRDSICRKVSNRVPKLKDFSRDNDVIVFVSGKKSSNGKYLYSISKKVNPDSYHISSVNELKNTWFKNAQTVGISGATSTPKWLMEKVAREIEVISEW